MEVFQKICEIEANDRVAGYIFSVRPKESRNILFHFMKRFNIRPAKRINGTGILNNLN